MTKEVLVTIKGTQLGTEEEPVIMTAPGTYHFANGKHYVHYEENLEESDDIAKNTIKIASNRIVLMKKGVQNAQMIFDLKEADQALYQTPFGNLSFQTQTHSIQIREENLRLEIQMEYSLYTEDEKLSDNRLNIIIEASTEE